MDTVSANVGLSGGPKGPDAQSKAVTEEEWTPPTGPERPPTEMSPMGPTPLNYDVATGDSVQIVIDATLQKGQIQKLVIRPARGASGTGPIPTGPAPAARREESQ